MFYIMNNFYFRWNWLEDYCNWY